MKFSYTISHDHYIDLLCALLKRQDRRPFQLLILFVLTIGQTLWAIYYCFTRSLSGKALLFIACWSVLMTIIALIPRLLRRTRAKITFKSLLSSNQLVDDFWSPHTFSFQEGDAVVSFGEITLSYPAHALVKGDMDGILLLYAGGKVFEFIPAEYSELKTDIQAALAQAAQSDT